MVWFDTNKTWFIPYDGTNKTLWQQTSYKSEAETIIVEEGFISISNNCFSYYSALKFLKLPDSVTDLGNNILYSSSIIEVHIPLNYKSVSTGQPFDNQYSLERFTISKDHETLCVSNGSLYSKDMKTLYYFPGGKKDKIIVIPQGVETIFVSAISFNRNAEILILPPSLSKAMDFFCYYLEAIRHVIFIRCESSPDLSISSEYLFSGSNFATERISWRNQSQIYYFADNSHLSVFVNDFCPFAYPVVFNELCFENNSFIESVSFNRGINSVEGQCFRHNKKLLRVSFPETITNVDKESFSYCVSLKKYSSIFYPRSILSILKPVFNSYVLGLGRITCLIAQRRITFIYFVICSIT
jgi:hypothetical protein